MHPAFNIGRIIRFRGNQSRENGWIRRKVAEDSDSRSRSVHELREELNGKIRTLDFLDEEQQSDLRLIVGEALTNACRHASKRCTVKVTWESTPYEISLSIVNPSNYGVQRAIALPEDCLAENGRGQVIISELVKRLAIKDNLHVRYRYRCFFGRTIFQVNIGR